MDLALIDAADARKVSDDQALWARAVAFTRLRIVLEPGGAVGFAAAIVGSAAAAALGRCS